MYINWIGLSVNGGRSGRKCIHENELNSETALGHVSQAYGPMAYNISKEGNKQR